MFVLTVAYIIRMHCLVSATNYRVVTNVNKLFRIDFFGADQPWQMFL